MSIRILKIDRSHPLYVQELDLRERVLLKPIGLSAETFLKDYGKQEEDSIHTVAVIDHPTGDRVIGTVLLMPDKPEKRVGKLSQMVVDPQRQSEGVGRLLVAEVEKMAIGTLGLRQVYCHAQTAAVGFYTKMGWVIEGEKFEEAGIEHFKMVCDLDPPDPSMAPMTQTIRTDVDDR